MNDNGSGVDEALDLRLRRIEIRQDADEAERLAAAIELKQLFLDHDRARAADHMHVLGVLTEITAKVDSLLTMRRRARRRK